MTSSEETNHTREADRIYRERLFDPTLEAPFLDTTDTHLSRARQCLARARGAAPPSTERAMRAIDGRARALAYSATLSEPLRPERSCLSALRSDELLAHIMLFCARGYDDYRDHHTIDNALACANRMFRRAAASRSVVAAKRRVQHTVFRCRDISEPDELDDAFVAMSIMPTFEVLELACAKRASWEPPSARMAVRNAWRNIFCLRSPPAINLCSRLRVLRLTDCSFRSSSWNGTAQLVDSPCLEELELQFSWPDVESKVNDSAGFPVHHKATSFVTSHVAAAQGFFSFMDRFTATGSCHPALRKLVLRNVCLCAVPAPYIGRWLRRHPALRELRITTVDHVTKETPYYWWGGLGNEIVRQFLDAFGPHEKIVDIPETSSRLPTSLPRLETIELDCGVALGFVDKIIRRAGALTTCQIGWQLPSEPAKTIHWKKKDYPENRGRGASDPYR